MRSENSNNGSNYKVVQVNGRFTSHVSNFIFHISRFTFLLLIAFSGCQIFLDVGDNIVRNFKAPRKVINKVQDPVRDSVKVSALWIGHATLLIQIYDKVILTDPLFTYNVAEVLRRYVEPGLDIENISKLDMILISHSHADHLSLGSLEMLSDKFPGADIVFPEGAEEFIPDVKFVFHKMKKPAEKFTEYIGETITIDGVKITTVAAFHWGGRYGIDGKLWSNDGYCGYIIQYKDVTVFYTGDTSYDDKFYKFIGDNYDIDLEIVNIIYCDGCKQINKNEQHIYPLGALKILDDTKAKFMIPAHYGTFTDPEVQRKVLSTMYLTNDDYRKRVKILRIGEQFVIRE